MFPQTMEVIGHNMDVVQHTYKQTQVLMFSKGCVLDDKCGGM